MSEQRSDIMQPAHLTEQLQTPIPMAAPPFSHQRGNSSSQASSTYQSPIAAQNKIQTPRAQNIPLPAHGMSHVSGLKRGSSAISGSSVSPQSSSRKRLRYDEIPIFARSARAEKQKSGKFGGTARLLDRAQPAVATPQIKAEPELRSVKQETNGTAFEPLASAPAQAPSTATAAMPWEASIVNVEPYEDLTRFMCDKMFQIIGSADPPIGGAKFEIEGKLGEIQTHDEQSRLDMPVLTETLIAKDNLRLTRTRFESSMTVGDHKHLNEYLNSCLVRTQKEPNRQIMHYKHTQETDNFYDLSPSGREMLPDHIRKYLNPMFKPRVRITTDLATGMIVAKIIKSRIADFDVYNPRCKFDYRMSISIECPWDGPESHLIMVNEAEGRRGERQKDRMSYRHLAYQVDLTQVTYPQTQKKEHELEIEVAPDALRAEIQLARDGRSNMYESLVRGFIDNIRLLSRQFPSGL